MANSSNVYENPSLSRGFELKVFKSQKNTDEEYYSTIDEVNNSVTKVDTEPAQQGDVKVKRREHVTSSIPPLDVATNDKYGSTPKSNVKLVIILIFVMIAIAAASSTVTALLFKKDLKIIQEELSAFKQDTLKVAVWSAWSYWDQCSVSCNGGIRTRNRTCDIPGQDKTRGLCTGNDVDISTCNNTVCTDSFVVPTIVFKAKTVTDKAPTDRQVLVFSSNQYNAGDGYNATTGVFTAPVTGLYHFTVQICTYEKAKIVVRLLVDDNAILTNTIGGAEWRVCSSADASAEMIKGTKAWVVAYSILAKDDNDLVLENSSYRVNAFSGILIHL